MTGVAVADYISTSSSLPLAHPIQISKCSEKSMNLNMIDIQTTSASLPLSIILNKTTEKASTLQC